MKTLRYFLLIALTFACSDEFQEVSTDALQEGSHGLVAKGPFSYLALGDSYTIGVGVTESERWPLQLVDKLQTEAVFITDVKILAEPGWTTSDLKSGIVASKIDETFDLISLLIGVNNQYRGYDLTVFAQEFEELLEMAISLADGKPDHILVLSIPDYSVTEFADLLGLDQQKIRDELGAYNEMAKEICANKGALFCDITSVSRMAAEDPNLTAPDGLHPSGEMYKKWVENCYQRVIDQLTEE